MGDLPPGDQSADRTHREFLAEAQEALDGYEQALLALERSLRQGREAPADVDDCFRSVHSLKGLAALGGLSRMSAVAHALEALLDAVRLDRIAASPSVLDVLFEGVEVLGQGLAAAADGGDVPPATEVRYAAALDELLRSVRGAPSHESEEPDDPLDTALLEPALREVLTEFEEHRARENLRRGRTLYAISESLDLASVDRELEALKRVVEPLGEVIAVVPGEDADDPERLRMRVLLGSDRSEAAIEREIPERAASVERVGVGDEPAPSHQPAPVPVAPRPLRPRTAPEPEPSGSLRSVSESVRVDIRRLDALMNSVGELALVHAELDRLTGALAGDRGAQGRALRRSLRALERRIGELQDGLLEVRMVPLRQIFDKLQRVVRKVARTIGKRVELDIGGAETELDKLLVEELSDPLMHVIRNAMDHGIETPEVRRAAGKPDVGTVSVRALQQGNRVVITVEDDGRGIDEQSVLDAALRRGAVDAEEAAALGRRDLFNLLFLPGVSTRREATELSGRGVGLDVVKTNIAHLSGTIDLHSTAGRGTTVTITLPVTLAIIQALVVDVAEHTYAVPLNGVLESLMLAPEDLRTVEGRRVISVRGQTLRLVYLDELFQLERSPDDRETRYVVVVGVAEKRLGLVVDQLVGQQDIVIKSIGKRLADVPGIAGATELGGQKTVLVLDVPGIVEESLRAEVRA